MKSNNLMKMVLYSGFMSLTISVILAISFTTIQSGFLLFKKFLRISTKEMSFSELNIYFLIGVQILRIVKADLILGILGFSKVYTSYKNIFQIF